MVLTNETDLERWQQHAQHFEMGTASSGYVASIAALQDSEQWFHSAMEQLHRNRQLFGELVDKHLPGASYTPPEATYLAWLDRHSTKNYADLAAHVTTEQSLSGVTAYRSGVVATDGAETGASGTGHLRINLATGPEVVEEIVTRLGQVYCQ